MELTGERIKLVRWIQGANFVVRVEVDAIVPEFDPSEPCLEPAAIRFLDDVKDKVKKGLIGELAKVGEVYVRQSA
jgi:hypothetical protein